MRGLPRFSAVAVVTALTLLGVFAIPAAASTSTLLTNGDFESSTLSGWTTFVTTNGTIGAPAVVPFDTTGSGASYAAQFDVGQVVFNAGVPEGGGIYQSVSTPAGLFDVSADIASDNSAVSGVNLSCGRFELLVDGDVVASHDFGPCQGVVRSRLSATGVALSAGTHEIRVRITRPFTNLQITPAEYVDNVSLAKQGGGNSANAKLCQKDGWRDLARADGTTFANQDECVSYGASGGTPVPKLQGQVLCASYGGTFALGGGGQIFWTCSGWTYSSNEEFTSRAVAINDACIADLGPNFAGVGSFPGGPAPGVGNTTCSHT